MEASLSTRHDIQAIINRLGFDNCTAKTIRLELEKLHGLEPDALKGEKAHINIIIEQILADVDPKAKPFSCTTRSGNECPKNIKCAQAKNGMTINRFLASNKQLTIDLDGNRLTGDPRKFSSGNLGWYLTGKVELEVDGERVWAQVGMNVTIPGSQSWAAV